MSWFSNLFKKKENVTTEIDRKWSVGYSAFEKGKTLYFNKQYNDSLPYFDKSIENGYDEAEAFEFRANCLSELEYYYDALDDYNISIQKNSENCDIYYMRSWTKQAIGDIEGQVEDIKEAIRISKLDIPNSNYWNQYAKETGYNSGADRYEMDLIMAEGRLESEILNKKIELDASPEFKVKLQEAKAKRMKVIKRREK